MCLHPLSYLIKKTNFNRLRAFSQNYILKKGILFSSGLFKNTHRTNFPILIALYERDQKGMAWEDIENFQFSLLDSKKTFCLRNYPSVDSFIRKYPPRKSDPQNSEIGIYWHTFRDINSLLRNQDFHAQKGTNSLVVSLENFYKYSYLLAFKQLFRPKDLWLYGNLSPLGERSFVEKNKSLFAQYALRFKPKFFSQLPKNRLNKISEFYSLNRLHCASSEQIKTIACKIIARD